MIWGSQPPKKGFGGQPPEFPQPHYFVGAKKLLLSLFGNRCSFCGEDTDILQLPMIPDYDVIDKERKKEKLCTLGYLRTLYTDRALGGTTAQTRI